MEISARWISEQITTGVPATKLACGGGRLQEAVSAADFVLRNSAFVFRSLSRGSWNLVPRSAIRRESFSSAQMHGE